MKHREFWLSEWTVIKRWGLPVLGMLLGGLYPIIGFWFALIGYLIDYPLWKNDPYEHRELKVFATLALVLSFLTMLGIIYLTVIETMGGSSSSALHIFLI